MIDHSGARPRTLVAALTSMLTLAVLALLPQACGAGEGKRSSSTTTWSSSSSGKGTRSETRRSTSKGHGYSVTTSDEDHPGELDAWTFSREDGHWRNTSGSDRDWNE